MEWDKKTEMVLYLNEGLYEKATDLVIENIDEMDEQAWEMFFSGIELTTETMKTLIERHHIISNHVNEIGLKTGSLRTALRMAQYENLVNKLKNEK